jgi:hypothetical protein
MDQPVREKTMPVPHTLIRLIRANNTFFLANRGGFKTTMGICLYVVDCVYELPRSTGIICGPSYEHLGDNTLNPLFNALNEDGFENGVHYVVGTKPPDEWEKPYIRVDSAKKYDHMISWHTGTNQFMVSMAKKGSSNGISAQWGVFDEIKLMSEADLLDVVFPVFRGNEQHFKNSALFMSKFFATDKLADPAHIRWILDKKKLNDYRKLDIVITLQLELIRLTDLYNQAGINARQKMKPQINAIEVRLAKLRSNLTFYVESDHTHTMQILGERWYQDKANSLKPYELKVAIRNEDPDRPEDGFYPDFNESIHCHELMDDYDMDKPLIIAADYQHSVAPIPIAQISNLPGKANESLNYIDQVFTLAPEGLEEAVQQLCDRYVGHNRKRVYYVYDHTAKGKRVDAEKYNKIVVDVLQKNYWKVVEVNTKSAPFHFQKYVDTKSWFKNEDSKVMEIRINKVRCPNLITSISTAPATTRNGKTEKDKKYENTTKYPKLDQSNTTHFSDCFDMINHAVLKLDRIKISAISGGSLGFR